jgi:crotonobetainyl-CoA:carnitine CoA-transferase CaiB-like acyl-CoA transferase
MAGPLDGLLVLDLSWGTPGAITGMLFADYGAHVVKVERPGSGVTAGTVARAAWDRGKWSIEADVLTSEGRDTVLALMGRADVVIESFGPGRADALGLGYSAVHARWPHLVYVSLTGYGLDTPWSDRPGYDGLVAALIGQMAEQPGPREGPKFLGHPSISYGTAFVATISALAALHARVRSGRGQLVDTSLLDGVLAQNCMNWWWNEGGLSYLARTGTEQGFGRGRLVTDLFVCADGEYVMVHTGGPGGFKRTMELLGLGDRVRAVEGALEMSVPLDDDELHVARTVVPEVMKTRPRAEWVSLFHAADLAALPVLKPGQVLLDEQVIHAGVPIVLDDPTLGPLTMAGPVIRFDRSRTSTPLPAPLVGRDNSRVGELLALPVGGNKSPAVAFGVAGGTDRSLGTDPSVGAGGPVGGAGSIGGGALAGLRVLDFSSFFATAYGAKFLSDLGADVIKVEPLEGDQMRPLPDPFEACQRGKRNIAVDLKSAAGRAIVADLVANADIVFHNLRPGKAEKIGIGYETLRAIKPDLIYCYLPGFGSTGPKSGLKSFAPLLSGFTGLLWESSGVDADRPVRRAMGNEDYNNGFVGAIAALMGLLHRDRTGEGQYIEMPQLHSSLLVTTEQCLGTDGQLVSGLSVDAEQMGWGPLYRLYPTSDGWICLAVVGDAAFARLRVALAPLALPEAIDYRSASGVDGDVVIKALTERLSELTSDSAFALLDAGGVPCEIAIDHPHMPDLLWEEWALESRRVLEHVHPKYGFIREIGFPCRLSDTPCEMKGPGAMLGQHTVEVLQELGYEASRVSALLSDGTCIAWSSEGEA